MNENPMTFEEACKNYEKKTLTEKLLQMIRENPDLPVVPMVHEEVVADDCHSWWLASFGMCSIDSYYSADERECEMFFASDWCKALTAVDMVKAAKFIRQEVYGNAE